MIRAGLFAPPPHPDDDVIVLGGGIAGLAAARMLCDAGRTVHVIEQADMAGGIHRSHQIGPYTFDAGSIFYEDNAQIFDLAPDLKRYCPVTQRVQRRISPQADILHYPVEPRDFLRARPLEIASSLLDLVWSRVTVRNDGTLDAILRKRMGRRYLNSTGLQGYITRFNQTSPAHIEDTFFFKRMAFLERFTRTGNIVKAGYRACVRQSPAPRQRAVLHVRPPQGFQALFQPIVAELQAQGVRFSFNEAVSSITPYKGGFHLDSTSGQRRCRSVVSTIPLNALHNALFHRDSGLRSLDMLTLFISAETLASNIGNVLFNFHTQGRWKRATVYSRIYPGMSEEREFFAVETTLPQHQQPDPLSLFEDIRAHFTQLGLATGLKLEGFDHVKDAYPLYACGTEQRRQAVIRAVDASGVLMAGRQGRFEYLPTASLTIRRVADVLNGGIISTPDRPSPTRAARPFKAVSPVVQESM